MLFNEGGILACGTITFRFKKVRDNAMLLRHVASIELKGIFFYVIRNGLRFYGELSWLCEFVSRFIGIGNDISV